VAGGFEHEGGEEGHVGTLTHQELGQDAQQLFLVSHLRHKGLRVEQQAKHVEVPDSAFEDFDKNRVFSAIFFDLRSNYVLTGRVVLRTQVEKGRRCLLVCV